MGFSAVFRTEAQIDLDEIFVWYEEQQPGLGVEFIRGIEDVIEKITRNPYHASGLEQDARSTSLKRFPYQVIYRVDTAKQQVRILAVIHHHREPDWFKKRLGIDE